MTKYACVHDGIVVSELIELPSGITPADAFHPDESSNYVPANETITPGMTWDGEAFGPPPPAPLTSKSDLAAYATDKRWQVEQAGTTWQGWPIHTDVASQGKYPGAGDRARRQS